MSAHRWSLIGLLCLVVASAPAARAQAPSPLSQPLPQAPVLGPAVPLGMQRGTGLELTLTGTNLAEPTGLWTSFPAKVTIPTDKDNGKDNAKLRVRLDVPADAPLGFGSLRLATTRGMSNFRLFCIDELPQVLDLGTNRSPSTAQAVPIPCVVVGRADAEVTDYFKISVRPGQRVSFDLLGRRLGSPLEPQLALLDARTGRELPGGFSHDAPGCEADPRLTYTFAAGGDYLIAVRDVEYRGGPDYGYRLRIGDFPCATTPVPMAARRGSKATVRFTGPKVEGVAPVEVSVPADPAVSTVWVAPKGPSGLSGWPVALAVSDHDEVVEKEPNDEAAKASRVPVPGGVTGRFEQKGDVDYFVFAGKKGQRLDIEAQSLELYSPTEVYMVLQDAKGGQLAATNPAAAPRIDYTPPADGDYYLRVENLLYAGGPSESYRVTVTPYQPGFTLGLFLDRYELPPGGSVGVPVILTARKDYTGPIELSVVGPAGVSGKGTIPAGAAAAPAPPAPQPAAATVLLTVKPDLPMGPLDVRIKGTATINGKPVVQYATATVTVKQAMANLTYPPPQLLTQVGLAVTEKPPFGLTARFDAAEALRGGAAPVTVAVTRAPGFTEEVAVSAAGLPPNVAAALKNVAKGQNEAKGQLNVAAPAALGSFPITFVGKAKYHNKDFSVDALPVPLVVALPFDLKVEPAALKLVPGGKVKLKVTAARKGGYAGPIALEVRNLPANVTAAKAVIPMGQTAAELEIAAAAAAAPASKADVNVLGTASAAANQQGPSPNFTVTVAKK